MFTERISLINRIIRNKNNEVEETRMNEIFIDRYEKFDSMAKEVINNENVADVIFDFNEENPEESEYTLVGV